MPEIDAEVVERVARWCAEAGRQAGTAEIRAALASLGWDELLAVKALLVDPPPARPLGPHALADLARGTPPDVAAEREREGRYAREPEEGPAAAGDAPVPARPPRRGAKARGRAAARFVIHRARDREGPQAPATPSDPRRPLEELFRPEGRAVLERLLRRHGARRTRLLAGLAAGFRGAAGEGPSPANLDALLAEHGLARAFERRERDEVLHAVRAASGLLGAAAARLELDGDAFASALTRLGIGAEVERIREERRQELRGRATLTERVRLLLEEEARLRDLALWAELEEDLRARLPEHVRALQAGGEPLAAALARTLSVTRSAAEALAVRFELDLSRPRPAASRPPPTRAPSAGPAAGRPPSSRAPSARPAAGRPPSARPPSARPAAGRPPSSRPPSARPAAGRPPSARPSAGPAAGRPPSSRAPSARPAAGRPRVAAATTRPGPARREPLPMRPGRPSWPGSSRTPGAPRQGPSSGRPETGRPGQRPRPGDVRGEAPGSRPARPGSKRPRAGGSRPPPRRPR